MFVHLILNVLPALDQYQNTQLFCARWIVRRRVTMAVGATVQIFIDVVQFFDNAKEVVHTMYYHVSKVCACKIG
jgi:hypothetical protein